VRREGHLARETILKERKLQFKKEAKGYHGRAGRRYIKKGKVRNRGDRRIWHTSRTERKPRRAGMKIISLKKKILGK